MPYAFGLGASLHYAASPRPGWLAAWLWISYGVILAGAVRAWWIPYAFGADAAKVERFRAMFAHTHAWLPERHGIRPNTLHVAFHLLLVGVIGLLGAGALH